MFHLCDVDKLIGRELQGVFAIRDFVVIQREFFPASCPCVVGEHGDGAMIAMVIDGPLREDGVRLFGVEDVLKGVVLIVIEHSVAIDLAGVSGARL